MAATFATLPFDHLFFTGSPDIGALVQREAAQNLVPVTLELGGKNPVVVAPDADIDTAAARIASARMVNGGQVCVCPDYVFVPEGRLDAFVDTARQELRRMFPSIVANADYCSSVNEPNFDRVLGLLDDARTKGAPVESVAPGGGVAARSRVPQDRADDRARRQRGDADRPRGDLRPGAGRDGLPGRCRMRSTTSTTGRPRWSPTGTAPTATTSGISSAAPAAAGWPAMTLPPK